MRNIIARCLQKNPNDRPTATELLQDKFFKVRLFVNPGVICSV
jgi:serine/threonine protein kinase